MASFLGEKFYLFSYVLSHHISRGPGGLQIEAAGDGIDVEHFAGKEEVRAHLALQGMQVDVAEADAAAGNKLFFEGSLAVYLIEVVGEGFYQQVATLLSHFAPFLFGCISHLLNQEEPEAGWQIVGADACQLLLRVGDDDALDVLFHQRAVVLVYPVHGNLNLIVVLVQIAGSMG